LSDLDVEEEDVIKDASPKRAREPTSEELCTMYNEIDQGMAELTKRVSELTKSGDIHRNVQRRPRGACGTIRDSVRHNTRQRNSVTPSRGSVTDVYDLEFTKARSSSADSEVAIKRNLISKTALRGRIAHFRTTASRSSTGRNDVIEKPSDNDKKERRKENEKMPEKLIKKKRKEESSSEETSSSEDVEDAPDLVKKKRRDADKDYPPSDDTSSDKSSDEDHSRKSRRRSARRGPRKWLIPEKFDGTTTLNIFLGQFESCAKYNKWNVDDKITQLRDSLEGNAAYILGDGAFTRTSYAKLVTRLKNRF